MKYRDALKARIAAATKGPWCAHEASPFYGKRSSLRFIDVRTGERHHFAQINPSDFFSDARHPDEAGHNVWPLPAAENVDFIAHSRTDVELLLAQLERAEAALASSIECKRCADDYGSCLACMKLEREALASLRAVLDAEEK